MPGVQFLKEVAHERNIKANEYMVSEQVRDYLDNIDEDELIANSQDGIKQEWLAKVGRELETIIKQPFLIRWLVVKMKVEIRASDYEGGAHLKADKLYMAVRLKDEFDQPIRWLQVFRHWDDDDYDYAILDSGCFEIVE